MDYTIENARNELGIDIDILREAYAIEYDKFDSPESQRLMTWIYI